jgi:hypothetical protein
VFIDRPRKRVGVGAWVALTGDVEADLAQIAAFYADVRGWRPERAGPIRFRDQRRSPPL